MLAIPIHRERPVESGFECGAPAGLECGAFALRLRMTQHLRTGLFGGSGGLVGGSVIDDEDAGQVGADCCHDRGDGGLFVEAGDDSGATVRPVHGDRLGEIEGRPSLFVGWWVIHPNQNEFALKRAFELLYGQ
jgi:hypothetical protein